MPVDMLSPKTVYIIGAGFSRRANVPLQDEILEAVRNFDISDAPGTLVDPFLAALTETSEFLDLAFGSHGVPSLEDIYTLIDQAVESRQFYLGKSWRELYDVGRALSEAILFLFHIREQRVSKEVRDFYEMIGAHLIQQRLAAGLENHPFSVISLNWDCVLDNAIYRCLDRINLSLVDIDYCCYSTPVPESNRHVASITQKSSGLHNIKLMKLHGSTNWMLCPNCNRLYTGLGCESEQWTAYILGKSCPRCQHIHQTFASPERNIVPPRLEPFLITPTFVKKFENPHIKMVWHNAYIDLCEAQDVVFIGYSLREADYHLRTLFKRAIRPDANIKVVLAPSDKPAKGNLAAKWKGATARYSNFFGIDENSFNYDGVRGHFKGMLDSQSLQQLIETIRRKAASIQNKSSDILSGGVK